MADVGATARAIVIHKDHILLIERWRNEAHYFTIPGGSIEPGETPELAVVRELHEETTIEIAPLREVITLVGGDPEHHIFLCEYVSGEPKLHPDSEERAMTTSQNRFEPKWVSLVDLPGIELAPSFTKLLLLNALKDGFPEHALIHVER